MSNKYQINKEKAREKAINFIISQQQYDYSYGELVDLQEHFIKLAKRYGLIKEFKENGVI